VAQLEAGWNAGDGDAFAAPFAADADYVVVDGAYISGRSVIAAGHRHILATVYRGSANCGTVEAIRFLRPDVAVARVRWRLRFDDGSGPQEAESRCQVVATREPGGWGLAVFQNTPVVARTPGPGRLVVQQVSGPPPRDPRFAGPHPTGPADPG
jgi:uncharacterized protein (TIGR02246 family)